MGYLIRSYVLHLIVGSGGVFGEIFTIVQVFSLLPLKLRLFIKLYDFSFLFSAISFRRLSPAWTIPYKKGSVLHCPWYVWRNGFELWVSLGM